jgi:hypothetical protein
MSITRERTLVEGRVIAYTTGGDHYNAWPDLAEIVDIVSLDTADAKAMYDFAYRLGTAEAGRNVRFDSLPHNIKNMLPEPAWGGPPSDATLIRCRFALCGPHGQIDDAHKRNLYVLFEPHARWNSPLGKNIFVSSHALLVTIGCKHDYDDYGSNHQRGYHKGKCRRCGHTFMVDSSD